MEFRGQSPDQILEKIVRDDEKKKRGRLKIFFGYAAGVGKTYSMLVAARQALEKQVDVVIGYVEPQARPQTQQLLAGFEVLPFKEMEYNGIKQREFDLDAALLRKPSLIIVDELAHTNCKGCRHVKRYQDVKELLAAGIDVYTTVNVQHIESLNDQVASFTGVIVKERIPDDVFDEADQVSLVDIEPEDLLERLESGNVYRKDRVEQAKKHFFTIENLTALREIAMRRCATRINLLEKQLENGQKDKRIAEHILVCVSPSPTNAKILRTASRMAKAFQATFTALYVETPANINLSADNKKRLKEHINLAQKLGATLETVSGDNIAFQIAEFSRLSGVTKIVVGKSIAGKGIFRFKQTLTDRLIMLAPDIDIYIIPDKEQVHKKLWKMHSLSDNWFSVADCMKSVGMMLCTTCIALVFQKLGFTEANIITIYILSTLITAMITNRQWYSLVAAMANVIIFNFFFTEPIYTLQINDPGYAVTFVVMFVAALLTGGLASKLKGIAKQSTNAAYRMKILFETNQEFSKVHNTQEIIEVLATQLIRLLNRDVVIYVAENNRLTEPCTYYVKNEDNINKDSEYLSEHEKMVAMWVFRNNKHAGATTNTLAESKCMYYAIRINDNVYGVVGIAVDNNPLEAFENSIFLSILGEAAMAMDSEKNAREKEAAALLAQNEKLRANLLRSISHDLRTPLTSISGNAGILISNAEALDGTQKKSLYKDIYEDALWLINLVENLLSVTRIENGTMNLRLQPELLEEIITEALAHTNRLAKEHTIQVNLEDPILLVKADARLIVQVFINIIDNAIKYTQQGSVIQVRASREKNFAMIEIADDGPGICENAKEHIFDMFYTANNDIVDSRRSMGLGLFLCKSIVAAHGGEIQVRDNYPKGTVFQFSLPIEEVTLHE